MGDSSTLRSLNLIYTGLLFRSGARGSARRERTRKGLLRKDPNADGVEDLLSFQSDNGKSILDLIGAGAGGTAWHEITRNSTSKQDPVDTKFQRLELAGIDLNVI